jgi:hypothetical protein
MFGAGLLVTLSAGWVGFPSVLYQRAAQPVDFSHAVHSGDKVGMKCDDCHTLRADGSFAGLPALDKCAGCHAQMMGNTPQEKILVDRYVTANREIPWKVYAEQPENVYFPHAAHVKLAKLACAECHGAHAKTDHLRPYERDRISGYSKDIWGASMARISFKGRPGMRMDDCVECHRARGLEHSCLECHK